MRFQELITRDLWAQLPDSWFVGSRILVRSELFQHQGELIIERANTNVLQTSVLVVSGSPNQILRECTSSVFLSEGYNALLHTAIGDRAERVRVLSDVSNGKMCVPAGDVVTLADMFGFWMEAEAEFPLSQRTDAIQQVAKTYGYLCGLIGSKEKLDETVVLDLSYFSPNVLSLCNGRTFIQLLIPVNNFTDHWLWHRYVQGCLETPLMPEEEQPLRAMSGLQLQQVMQHVTSQPIGEDVLTAADDRIRWRLFLRHLREAISVACVA